MAEGDKPVVVICQDIGHEPVPLRPGELAARTRRELSGVRVVLGVPLCGSPGTLAEAVRDVGTRRVVVGCRGASAHRGELLAELRRSGVPISGAQVVDLEPTPSCSEADALETSVVLLCAGVARVGAANLSAPVRERVDASRAGISRRSLLRSLGVARRAVAVWGSQACDGGVACTACVIACPQGALSRRGGRLVVDEARCTGCGVCVTACHHGAFTLPGADLAGMSAALGELVAALGRSDRLRGVAIACVDSKQVPLVGEGWLVLMVPSVEMVGAGWLLQLVSRRANVRVVPCDADGCRRHAQEIEGFVGDLAKESIDLSGGIGMAREPFELREPQATLAVLERSGALGAESNSWSVRGAGCPLGLVSVDTLRCTGCGVCGRACPTGALGVEVGRIASLRLGFDARSCDACGACVATCPETALSVERLVDPAALTAGRRVLAQMKAEVCEICGATLASRLPAAALRRLVGDARGEPSGALGSVCANCRLAGRAAAAIRHDS
jgi:ferredoxin